MTSLANEVCDDPVFLPLLDGLEHQPECLAALQREIDVDQSPASLWVDVADAHKFARHDVRELAFAQWQSGVGE